ncbi:hypothetical protein NC652_014358 [Populus alba x Populus x berolinensis]|nr:hypothetical protein NC652_014358 [Populus alba x Populus x berolinensis]
MLWKRAFFVFVEFSAEQMATSPHPCCIRRIPPYGCVVEAQCGHQCRGCVLNFGSLYFPQNGWTALHRAIVCKKQAITSYLLRESADPFVRDAEGATLMHYAVQTASAPAIKLLLLYNVDINLQDNDGWTPLHLAVQTQRTDIVKLLLIKRADKTLKNKDGLTPLDLCLSSGRDTRTYELIKLLKQFTKKPTLAKNPYNASASQLL